MLVTKTPINNVRNGIKIAIKKNEDLRKMLNHVLESTKILDMLNTDLETRLHIISSINSICGLNLSFNAKPKFIREILKFTIDTIVRENKRNESIVMALSREGINSVTYGLPFLAITCFSMAPEYAYFMVTGIKKNTQEKSISNELMDELEINMLQYEKEMAKYIRDDYSIDLEHIEEFIEIYKAYIRDYLNGKKLMNDPMFIPDVVINTILLNMGYYAIYSNFNILLKVEEYNRLGVLYSKMLSTGLSSGETIKILVSSAIQTREEKTPNLQDKNISESKETSLNEYIEDGKIKKICELEKFVN